MTLINYRIVSISLELNKRLNKIGIIMNPLNITKL